MKTSETVDHMRCTCCGRVEKYNGYDDPNITYKCSRCVINSRCTKEQLPTKTTTGQFREKTNERDIEHGLRLPENKRAGEKKDEQRKTRLKNNGRHSNRGRANRNTRG